MFALREGGGLWVREGGSGSGRGAPPASKAAKQPPLVSVSRVIIATDAGQG